MDIALQLLRCKVLFQRTFYASDPIKKLYMHRILSECIRVGFGTSPIPSPASECAPPPQSTYFTVRGSVADPDPPPDPHVFGPPGSGSTS
jgi:hypothetical protein